MKQLSKSEVATRASLEQFTKPERAVIIAMAESLAYAYALGAMPKQSVRKLPKDDDKKVSVLEPIYKAFDKRHVERANKWARRNYRCFLDNAIHHYSEIVDVLDDLDA